MGKEVVSKIPMLKIIQWNFNLGLQLSVSDNRKSIALFMRPNNHEDFITDYRPEDFVLHIWVMKEYIREESWTKMNALCPQGPETIFPAPYVLGRVGKYCYCSKKKRGRN
ncbi:unnamed protein product [Prunus armeniaca]